MKKEIVSAIFLTFFYQTAFAEPIISNIEGVAEHKSTIIISGTSFGEKYPAKPIIWDDCENSTVNTFPSSTPNSYSQVAYTDYQPADTREGEDVPDSHELNYRNTGYAPVSQNVMGPHSHSTKYLCGGHYEDAPLSQSDPASGRDVQITIPNKVNFDRGSAESFSNRWFATWYYRLNPEWPECGDSQNHKTSTVQSDISAYGGSTYQNDFNYHNFNNSTCPCTGNESILLRNQSDIGSYDDLRGMGDNQNISNPKLD